MKRESLITKLVAFMLCVMMVVGCLPLSAFATDDWEGEMDGYEYPVGSQENPAEAIEDDNAAPEGSTEYYWTYTEDHDCVMVITSAADITVNDTVYAVEEGAEEVTVELAVKAEDVISVCSLSFTLGYKSGSCAEHYIFLGSTENTVTNAGTVYYNGYFSGTTMTVSGEGDFSVTYNGETIAAVDGVVSTAVSTSNPRMPVEFSVTGDGEYSINFVYPVGSANNPLIATLGDNEASVEAGNTQGFLMVYTADYTGNLVVTLTAEAGWTYVINNMTTYAYGDTQWSDSDPVVNPATIAVTAGDEIQIIVNTYDPADSWNNPAGDITVNLAYELGSCPEAAIFLGNMENNVTNEGTVYYQGYFSGTTMTVSGEGDFSVTYNGETIAAVDGVVSIPVSSANPRMPVEFSVTGDGDYTVNFAYPEGSASNPAIAVLGDNVASIEAGAGEYYWNYTAEEAGNLIVTISADAGWQYTINNMTSYVYGDTQWSDSDPVVNPATIEVAEGDLIEIKVVPYDPENPYANPAGDITVNLAYEVTGPEVDENLKFYQVGLSFAEYIGVQPMMLTSVVKNYDSYYVEAVLTREDSTETIVLEPTLSTSTYNVYDVQMLPRAMTDGVTLTIYAVKDGVTYCSNPVNTSITALAIEKIGTYLAKDDLGACTVLVDMLNYGTEVQKAFDYKTDDVPSNYLGEYAVYGTTGDIAIEGAVSTSGSGIKVFANSLSLGSKVEVQFMFKTSAVEGCELRYTLNGETIAVPASEFDTTVMSGYSVAIFAMKPRNFRDTMTIAVYDADGAVISAVYTASIEDYAAGAITKYPTLVPAMMAYGDAVLARFPG